MRAFDLSQQIDVIDHSAVREGATVFGGSVTMKPDWCPRESVHSVCPIAPRKDPLEAIAETPSGLDGAGSFRLVGEDELRTYGW